MDRPEILPTIESPDQVSGLSPAELRQLAQELRAEILRVVSQVGGHLGASLGVAELTVALHHCFDSPKDKIVWDVGHQAYGHKLLTGRREQFSTIRQWGGISGFPHREESPHDAFGVGHASTSISAALGFCKARDLRRERHHVIAVIGDGALSGGIAYEGMNNAGQLETDLIVILNDNEMSISPNVGAMSRYLTQITTGGVYTRMEAEIVRLLGKLPAGEKAQNLAGRIKEALKNFMVPGQLFEAMGFRYFGPLDGHDIDLLVDTFEHVKKMKGPILIHLITRKGKGYSFAEKDAARYHGVASFDPKEGVKGNTDSFHNGIHLLLNGGLNFIGRDNQGFRNTRNQITPFDLHRFIRLFRHHIADGNLNIFRGTLTNGKIMFTLDILENGLIHLIAGNPYRLCIDTAGKRNNSNLCCSAADINDHVGSRLCNGKIGTNRCCHGFFNKIDFTGTGRLSRFPYCSFFHLSNSRGD